MKRLPRLLAHTVILLSFGLAALACKDEDGPDADTVSPTDATTVVDITSPCEGGTSGGACEGTASCDLGEECCCGQCYPSRHCECANGTWICAITDACLVPACPDVTDADVSDASDAADTSHDQCPSATPNPSDACVSDGASCDFGEECCCGQCHPSLHCSCSGGTWACYYTDACMIPACPDVVDGDASGPCESATTTLAAALYGQPQAFSVIVRLAHDTRAVLSYAVVAGPYAHPDEATARATSQSATGFGDGAQSLAGADPTDDWLFYQPPGDFGGVGVVSAHTGLAVFGGSIVWSGHGDITYPATWSPPSELASGCPASGGLGTTRGFDLVKGTALSAADVKAATDVILDTAIPAAIWRGGYAFDAMVLRYPRRVGVFDPSTAEWVVIVSGGWLE